MIHSDSRGQLATRWIAALVANGFFGTLGLLILTGRMDTTSVWWNGILLGIAGAALLLFPPAVIATMRWLRFRQIVLQADPPQGSLGGHIGGSLRIPGAELRDASFSTYVICLAREAVGGESGGERVYWMRGVRPRVDPGVNGVRLTFAIPLPEDLPPTGPDHRWAVRVTARRRGPDMDLAFPVEVCRHTPPRSSSLPVTERPPPEEAPVQTGRHITIRHADGVTVLRYRAGRSAEMGLTLVTIGLVSLASGLFTGRASWQGFGSGFDALFSTVGLVFLCLFGLIGATLALFGVWLLGNGLRVELSPRQIRVRRSFLLPGPTREWAADELDRIEARITGQVLQGSRSRVEYAIEGVLASGESIPLGDGIRGPLRLDRVSSQLQQVTGLPVEQIRGRVRRVRAPHANGRGRKTGTES